MATLFHFIIGIILLYLSADLLINAAVRLAELMRVRPFIIGITVISFASSIPELSISLVSLYHKQPDIMIGNVIGSNIANLGLILPIAVLIHPSRLKDKVLSRDVVVMFMATILFFLFLHDGSLSRWEGVCLFTAVILYNFSLIHSSHLRKSKSISHYKTAKLFVKGSYANWKCFLLLAIGMVGMIYSAKLIVHSAVELATVLGISKMVISISIVAVATALPELGLAIVSSIQGKNDILLGNVIGSNVNNLLFVAGFSGSIFPTGQIGEQILLKLIAMIFFSLFLLPFVFKEKVKRGIGSVFLGIYFIYILLLFLL